MKNKKPQNLITDKKTKERVEIQAKIWSPFFYFLFITVYNEARNRLFLVLIDYNYQPFLLPFGHLSQIFL